MRSPSGEQPAVSAGSSAEQRLALALEAGKMGAWQWDLATNRVTWSAALERAHGIPEGSFAGTFEAYQEDIHPEDRERVLSTIARTLEHGEDHHLEYRIIRPDGALRWLEASGRVLSDERGQRIGMMGVCTDVTERKLADLALRESESWFSTTLASVGDAVVATDGDGRIRYLNPVGEQLTGWSLAEAQGRPLSDVLHLIHEQSRVAIESPIAKVLRDGTVVGLANHTILVRRDGIEISIDDSAAPIRDPQGGIIGVVMVFRDVTHKRLEDARQAFLQEAMRVLASSLDPERAVATVAALAVPRVADWCAVDLIDDDGALRRLAVAHVDPGKVELAHELHRRYPPDPQQPHGAHAVLRTGVSELVAEIPDEFLVQSTRDAEHLAIARALGLKSYMVAPIRGADRILGAVSFVIAEANRRFTPEDLRHAEQLCDCAAVAITNARLYRGVQRAQAEAEAASARAAKLQEVAFALANTTRPSEVADVAMNQAFRHLEAAASVLYVFEGESLQLAGHRGFEGSVERLRILDIDAPLPLAKAVRTRSPQWFESREELLEEYPHLNAASFAQERLRSVIALPLEVHGVVLGGLAFSFAEPRRFSPIEREMLISMAGQIAQSLERTRLREAESATRGQLEENEARYRYIFEAAAVGIAEKDYTDVKRRLDAIVARGVKDVRAHLHMHPELVEETINLVRVRDVNAAMMRLFKATQKSQLLALRSIFFSESRDLFIEELVALMEGTRIVSGEALLRGLDGKPIYALTTIVFPPAGFDRVLVSRTDITEHKRILRAHEDLVEELSATVRFNETFAAILGHDLRSPLSAILTGAQIVMSRSQDEALRRPLSRIIASGERMARMIEQLLDFTRARMGGGIHVERKDTDFARLSAQMIGEMRDAHPGAPIELRVSGGAHGSWDADRLAQVISNLVGNACQHRSEGSAVLVQLDGTAPDAVDFSVVNHGEIPSDVLPVLFDPFRSGRRRGDRAHGLGLGLFITQQVVRAHGGSISATSCDGRTTMTVRLPRESGASPT